MASGLTTWGLVEQIQICYADVQNRTAVKCLVEKPIQLLCDVRALGFGTSHRTLDEIDFFM